MPQLDKLLIPPPSALIYDSELVYAALASYPLTKGHTVVVWKKQVSDLGKLTPEEYAYLMLTVDKVRNVLMQVLNVKKVYLFYMDEVKHVHWHLIPRYNFMGMSLLKNEPKQIITFPLATKLRHKLEEK
jgi:diadenosine tetraphosphate (Ap4A) HIT family hydrolase